MEGGALAAVGSSPASLPRPGVHFIVGCMIDARSTPVPPRRFGRPMREVHSARVGSAACSTPPPTGGTKGNGERDLVLRKRGKPLESHFLFLRRTPHCWCAPALQVHLRGFGHSSCCRQDNSFGAETMKVVSSIGALKFRHPDCQVVRRRGRIYVICKSNPRYKVRQGGAKNRKRKR